jgi:hypothetical protein
MCGITKVVMEPTEYDMGREGGEDGDVVDDEEEGVDCAALSAFSVLSAFLIVHRP